MKDKIIRWVFIIFGSAWLIFIFFGLLYEYVLKKEPDWDKIGVKNVGQVYKISGGGGSGSGAWIEHYLYGNRYSAFDGLNFWGIVLGDRFNILYDPSNPESFKVISWEPVFTEEEETKTIKGELVRLSQFKWWGDDSRYSIKFDYEVNRETYTRGQDLPPNYKTIYPTLSVGQTFEVKYWVSNPQRAIIYLDKPIKE